MGRKKGSIGNNGGGRKKVENPTNIRVKVPTEQAQQVLKNHGTYSNAIRFAAENKPKELPDKKDSDRVLRDYDIWYHPCGNCGFDTGKASKKSLARCWKCGLPIRRDYTDRALKNKPKEK